MTSPLILTGISMVLVGLGILVYRHLSRRKQGIVKDSSPRTVSSSYINNDPAGFGLGKSPQGMAESEQIDQEDELELDVDGD